jgi:hypothetical protein
MSRHLDLATYYFGIGQSAAGLGLAAGTANAQPIGPGLRALWRTV